MIATNYSSLREHMKDYFDQVTDESETLVVTRKNNNNVVILSQDAYNNLLENIHLFGDKTNYEWLVESKAQLEAGHASEHELLQ